MVVSSPVDNGERPVFEIAANRRDVSSPIMFGAAPIGSAGDLDDRVQFAVLIGVHCGIEGVVRPAAVDHQSIAIPPAGQLESGLEIAPVESAHRRSVRHPVVEVAGQLHFHRIGISRAEDHDFTFLPNAVDRGDPGIDLLRRGGTGER